MDGVAPATAVSDGSSAPPEQAQKYATSEDVDRARQSGQFAPEEINGLIDQQRPAMAAAGFSQAEIDQYYGVQGVDEGAIKSFFKETAKNVYGEGRTDVPDFMTVINSAFEHSSGGLMLRGKLPSTPDINADDLPLAQRVAYKAESMAGDVPAMLLGAGEMGLISGGNPLAIAGGTFAMPAALRRQYMEEYSKGSVKSFSEYWNRVLGIGTDAFKGFVTGAATEATGGIVPSLLKYPAQVAAMVAVGDALDGKIPKWQEFFDAALLLGGMKAVTATGGNLKAIFSETGKTPADVMKDAAQDPAIREDVLSSSVPIPRAYAPLVEKQAPEVDHAQHAPEEFKAFAKDYEPTKEGAHQAAQDMVVGKGRETGFEHLIGTDKKTGLAFEYKTDNSKDFVSFSDAYLEKLTNPENQIVSHHNHPRGTVVSRGDIVASAMPGSAEVIAHGHKGELSIVSVPKEIKEEFRGLPIDGVEEKIKTVYNSGAVELGKTLQDFVKKGDIEEDQGQKIYREVINRSLAKHGIINYASNHPVDYVTENVLQSAEEAADRGVLEGIKKAGIKNAKTNENFDRRADTLLPGERASSILGRDEEGAAGPSRREGSGGAGGKTPKGGSGEKSGPGRAARIILSKISIGESAKRKYSFDELYKDAVDNLSPLKDVVKAIADGKELPVTEDPYKLARLSRGVNGKAEHFLDFGTFDYKTMKNNGPGLRQILEPVKDNLDNFRAYAVARRSFELRKRGIETGIDAAASDEVFKTFDKEYGPIFAKLKGFQDKTLKYIYDAGLLTEDAYKTMQEANKNYVPFYRVMTEDGDAGSPKSAGRGFQARNPVKGIKGSERVIVDPLESIIKNTYLYLNLAEKNRVANSLIDIAEKSPRGADFVTKARSPMRPTKVGAGEIEKFLAENGITGADIGTDTMTVFRPNAFFPSENQIRVFREGKPELYDVDPEIAKVLKGLDAEGTSLVFKILGAPVRTLRAGVTLNPDFFARNIMRDQLTAAVFSTGNYRPFIDAFNGLGSIVGKDEAFTDWLKSGGANSNFVSLDREYLQEHMQQMLTQSPVRNLLKSPLMALRIVSELAENATRVGEYKRVTKGSRDAESLAKGGFSSREVTLDFARIGARTRALNQIVAFWNANVQGTDRMLRAFKDNPMATTAKTLAYITVPSVLLYLANKDDQRYKDLPGWQKDLYWIVLTKDHIYRIPKPFELGLFFGTGAERFTQYILDKDPKAFDGLLADTGSALAPGYVPTIAAPGFEMWANKSLFTGAPIIPSDRENMLPEYQYKPYTTELTKKLGSMLATLPGMKESPFVAPVNIDQFVQDWSGGLGMQAVNIADAALRKTGILPDPPKPASTLEDMPFIKAFMVRYPSMGTKPITDFYDRYKSNETALVTIKKLAKEGNAEASIRELTLRQGNLLRLTPVKQGMDNAVSTIRMIEQNPQIDPVEKRQLMDKLYYQINEMARAGNTIFDAAEKASGKK